MAWNWRHPRWIFRSGCKRYTSSIQSYNQLWWLESFVHQRNFPLWYWSILRCDQVGLKVWILPHIRQKQGWYLMSISWRLVWLSKSETGSQFDRPHRQKGLSDLAAGCCLKCWGQSYQPWLGIEHCQHRLQKYRDSQVPKWNLHWWSAALCWVMLQHSLHLQYWNINPGHIVIQKQVDKSKLHGWPVQ